MPFVEPLTETGQSIMVADDVIRRLIGHTLLKEDAIRVAEALIRCVKPDDAKRVKNLLLGE
jgi:hypothetical protein